MTDIKRCNGLLSDSALYARSEILVPTAPLPIGYDCRRLHGFLVIFAVALGRALWMPRLATRQALPAAAGNLTRWPFRPLSRQECSTWAGMILTDYGSVSAVHDVKPSESTSARLKLVHRAAPAAWRLRGYHSATNSVFDGSGEGVEWSCGGHV